MRYRILTLSTTPDSRNLVVTKHHHRMDNILERLIKLEGAIDRGDLVWKTPKPEKYWGCFGYRDYYGRFRYQVHHVAVEYEKASNRVAAWVEGKLFTTSKDLLFSTRKEAEGAALVLNAQKN